MMLTEETLVPEAALPVDSLKQHLRMGSGFGEDDLQDAVLGSFLRAAIAAIEGRTAKALIARQFLQIVQEWTRPDAQTFAIAPVRSVESVSLVDRFGAASPVAPSAYRLVRDAQAPTLRALATSLPAIPEGGAAELRFVAGFAEAFDDLPPDLSQAVLMLAAHFYDHRDDTGLAAGCMPFGVTSLLSRYRPMRMGFSA